MFEPTVIEDFKRRLSPPSLPLASPHDTAESNSMIPGFRYIDAKAPLEEVRVVKEKEGRGFKVAAFAPSFISTTLPDREEVVQVVEEELDGRDVYGEDVDGEDVDGVDLGGEDVDGEEMEDNLDGEDLDGEEVLVAKPLQEVILEEDSDDDMF